MAVLIKRHSSAVILSDFFKHSNITKCHKIIYIMYYTLALQAAACVDNNMKCLNWHGILQKTALQNA